jgi:SAM-dependent methyltransferase
MSNPDSGKFDASQFKIDQRKNWDGAAAGWQKWWKTAEDGAQKISEKLVELAEIKSGNRVLDVATGIGEPAITAARIVGEKGYVLATDISPQMLAIGRERAMSHGLQDIIEFKEGDAELVDLPNATFQAAICRWGLMFLPNLSIALSNIQKSLVSGGKFATAVWADPIKVPLISLSLSTVRKQLNIPAPPPNVPSPFSLADVDMFTSTLSQAGFGDINHEIVEVTFEFNSPEDYVRYTQDISAPIKLMLANETEMRREEIWKILGDRVRIQYAANGGGSVRFKNEAICVVGQKR